MFSFRKIIVLLFAVISLGGIMASIYFHRTTPNMPAKIPAAAISVTSLPYPAPELKPEFSNPVSPATDADLLTLARPAVAQSPERAIAWARSQSDSRLARRLLSAVLHAWGERDPIAACDWITTQSDEERQTDMDAALAGAIVQPQLAIEIVSNLMTTVSVDSNTVSAWGSSLILALTRSGDFQNARKFLTFFPDPDLTTATFHAWAQAQPQAALAALDTISDPQLRTTAFHALTDGWSATDPAALATTVAAMHPGENRDYALHQAFSNWSLQDPAALATWLNTQPPGAEFDQAAALMIAKADAANYPPETALEWVNSITDPTLKLNCFAHLLSQWNQSDPVAAQQSVANATWLNESQRSVILKNLQSPPPMPNSDD